MRRWSLAAVLLASCGRPRESVAIAEPAATVAARSPVVLELFTSEGCSSCPSAEELLTKLKDEPNVYALAFHVDYWNGVWTDRFSSMLITRRQREYGYGTYTPQLVVHGRTHVPGSDESAARTELESTPAMTTALSIVARSEGTGVNVAWDLDRPTGELVIAVTEDGIVVTPTAGENKGDTLRHDAVVRAFVVVPATAKGEAKLSLPADVVRARSRVIAFMQRPAGAVLAAARTAL